MNIKGLSGIVDLSPERRELLAELLEEEGIEFSEIPGIHSRKEDETLPLSFAQTRLWFLDRLAHGNRIYNNMPNAFRLTGALHIAALVQNFNEIIRRHEVLRTTFPDIDGEPIQVVCPILSLIVPMVDLSALPEAEQDTQVYRMATEESKRFFDLARGPLLRAILLRLATTEHIVLFTMHHIVSDGWSNNILTKEVAALYEALLIGNPSSLDELPIQYGDFAIWQRKWIDGESLEYLLSYWKRQLADAPPLLELSAKRPRPKVQSFRGAIQTFMLPMEQSKALSTLSQQEEVTLFMMLLASFVTLIHRYTEQDDIVVGTGIANRNRNEIEPLIGFFVNTLVIRTDMSDNPSFRELVSRVRQVILEAYDHQDLPFEKLVETLEPERTLSYSPLYQVEFVFQSNPTATLSLPNLTLNSLKLGSNDERLETDLNLEMWEVEEGLLGQFSYSTDLFDATTINRMINHFKMLIEGIVIAPQQRLSDLPLLTEPEYDTAINIWNNTQVNYSNETCLHHLFEDRVRQTPDAIAVTFDSTQLTYQQLNRRANQVARHLQRLGIGPELQVALLLESSIEMVIGLLGVLKAGGAYVPLDVTYPAKRLAFMQQDAQVKILLTQGYLKETISDLSVHVICIDDDWQKIDCESEENLQSAVITSNLAYVIYTSGSTGKPKGVGITHKSVVNYTLEMQKKFDLTSNDRILQLAPLSFDVAFEEIFPTWLSSATVVLQNQVRSLLPNELSRVIDHERVTGIELPASYWHEWIDEHILRKEQLPASLRFVIVGCEKPSAERLTEWKKSGIELIYVFGLTEATITSTLYRLSPNLDNPAIISDLPIGRPIANTQIYLLSSYLQPVPVGRLAELFIAGDGLARGYFNVPDLTAERFIPNPFSKQPGARMYSTGDLVCYQPDGNLLFRGRIDYQVNLRGYRIETAEIEAVLKQHEDVADAVVITQEKHKKQLHSIQKKTDGQIQIVDNDRLRKQILSMNQKDAEELLADIENLKDEDVAAILANELQLSSEGAQTKIRRFPEFDIILKLKDKQFIDPPRESQKNWIFRRLFDEFADDLRHLDKASKRFVPGSARHRLEDQIQWNNSQAYYDNTQLIIENQQVMQDWEHPLMEAMAKVVTEKHGDVLELGFGMGISATYIQKFGVRSYTVVEYNNEVVRHLNEWKKNYPGRDIRLIHGKWHDVVDQLGIYDGIFFDTVPVDEEEYLREVIDNIVMAEDFFPIAAKCLREGGIFTWYTNEIDSFSRRHQRLVLKYFSSFTISIVEPLSPPADCHYWFADSMVVVKAIK